MSYLNLSWIVHFCLSSRPPAHFPPIETTTILFPDYYSCLQIFLFTVLFYSLPSVTLFPIAVSVTYTSNKVNILLKSLPYSPIREIQNP